MSSIVTIEKMDSIIQRVPGTTYGEAKQALVDCNGDVIEAIVLLESKCSISNKTKKAKKVVEDAFNKDGEEFKEIKSQRSRRGYITINIFYTLGLLISISTIIYLLVK